MGIDGSLTLSPGQLNNRVRLEEPVLYASMSGISPQQIDLPASVFPREMNQVLFHKQANPEDVILKRYLPYAKEKPLYQAFDGVVGGGIELLITAPQASMNTTLSSPPSDYPETTLAGPMKLSFLGTLSPHCQLPPEVPSKRYVLLGPNNCYFFKPTKNQKKIVVAPGVEIAPGEVEIGQENFTLRVNGNTEFFIPALSAWPLTTRKNLVNQDSVAPHFKSAYRIYDVKEIFAGNVIVLYFQKDKTFSALYEPNKEVVITELGDPGSSEITTPWMGLKIYISEINRSGIPYRSFVPTKPSPGDENKLSAVALMINGFVHWLDSSGQPFQIPLKSKTTNSIQNLELFLGMQTFQLPWLFRLERFKMDTDPGTRNPASYESFVNVREPQFENLENAHIYMNNPLKKGKYTFYQASYFETGNNQFGSVLQVNYDPGRYPKYVGSFLIVMGTIVHFIIRRVRNA
jgi:hypothetical protein